jgi:hypothetical protein
VAGRGFPDAATKKLEQGLVGGKAPGLQQILLLARIARLEP